jgi:hypothetical protein
MRVILARQVNERSMPTITEPAAEQVREANLAWIRSRDINSVESSVIYAVARKPQSPRPIA